MRFWGRAAADPARVAIIDPDGREHTAGDIGAQVDGLVAVLTSRGLTEDDAVAVSLPNRHEWIVVYLAAMQAGWYLVPVNHHLTAPEVTHLLVDSGARALVAHEASAELNHTVAVEAGIRADLCLSVGEIPGFEPLAAAVEAGSALPVPARRAGAVMYYTSGTTGKPKGVRRPRPEGDPEYGPLPFSDLLELFGVSESDDDVHLCGSPLYHTAVLAFAVSSLHMGHPVVLMDKWTARDALDRIEKYRVTHTHMVPTQFRRLLLLPDAERVRYDCSSLRCVVHGAAPCDVSIKQAMIDWWGPVIFEYYGTTEGGGTVVTPADWLDHPGTVGRPWPGADLRILDENGSEVPRGTPGTVYILAAGSDFEYYNDEAKTRANRVGDYFTVGDLGYMDEAGYLYLLGRSSELIISAGVNIYPAEIESVLISHPAVADVAVIGAPDPDRGEAVVALVEVAPGVAPSEALATELLDSCRARLAAFKLPRSLEFVDALPRDPSGKIRKRLLSAGS